MFIDVLGPPHSFISSFYLFTSLTLKDNIYILLFFHLPFTFPQPPDTPQAPLMCPYHFLHQNFYQDLMK